MNNHPDLIKIAAVVTAIPRWVVALMAAEGLGIPVEWRPAWVFFSAVSAVGMAIVEGMAFSYVFSGIKRAWQLKNSAHVYTLSALAVISAMLFVMVLAPALSATVRGVNVGVWIKNDVALTAWQLVVAGATISIVASVGYAETIMQTSQSSAQFPKPTTKELAKLPQAQLAKDVPEVTAEVTQTYPSRYEKLTEAQRLELVSKVANLPRAEGVKIISDECRISPVSARKWWDMLHGVEK